MGKMNTTQTIAERNRIYFMALANTRGSVTMLPAMAGPIIFILAVLNFRALNPPRSYGGYEVLSVLRDANQLIIAICALFLILSFIKKFSFRAQLFFSVVMAAMAVVLVYVCCLMAVVIATLTQARGEQFCATLFNTVGLLAIVLVVGSAVVHALSLRHRLRVGHSAKRTMGNFLAVSGSNKSKIFWAAFGVVAVVSNLITRGQYLLLVLGLVTLCLFAGVMTGLPVEFAYLAYLKSKDRAYWEERPRPTAKERQRRKDERVKLARKALMSALIAVAVIAAICGVVIVRSMWFG